MLFRSQLDTARAIVAHESDDFLTLARAAGLTAPDVWEGADLRGVRVAGDVAGMSFRRSDLRGADLRGARGLTAEAIADAITDAETLGLPHPPDFSIDRVKRMVLAGERVPEAWVPFVKVLDLSGMGLTDLSPLAGLTALISLDLSHRWVVDTEQPRKLLGRRAYSLDGLAEIISVANIDYLFDQNLQIFNLSPLAGLVNDTLSALLPFDRRIGLVGALVFCPSPVNSMTVFVPSSTFTVPVASTLKRKSPRKSAVMNPLNVAVNFPEIGRAHV